MNFILQVGMFILMLFIYFGVYSTVSYQDEKGREFWNEVLRYLMWSGIVLTFIGLLIRYS